MFDLRKDINKLLPPSVRGKHLESSGWGDERRAFFQPHPFLLLLVVNRDTLEFLALRVGSARSNRTALAVGRHVYTAASRNGSTPFAIEAKRVFVDPRERPKVFIRITDDCIVF